MQILNFNRNIELAYRQHEDCHEPCVDGIPQKHCASKSNINCNLDIGTVQEVGAYMGGLQTSTGFLSRTALNSEPLRSSVLHGLRLGVQVLRRLMLGGPLKASEFFPNEIPLSPTREM